MDVRELLILGFLISGTFGAATAQAPRVTKIDPPNWYATLPKPMLLVQGENLRGARFSVSDSSLQVERSTFSENGHWAQVWLSAPPAKPEP